LLDLEKEMNTSHTLAKTQIEALEAGFGTCDTGKQTVETNAEAPDGSTHSTCRDTEADEKRKYDACHSAQETLHTLKTNACSSWVAVRDKVASKEDQPGVASGEKHLDYLKRLRDYAIRELASGEALKEACDDATEKHDDKVVECEGDDGNGALKKKWLDAKHQCNLDQGSFETASCAYTQTMETACAVHGTCFSNAADLWDTETALIKADAESRVAAFEMVQRIRCFLKVFHEAKHHNEVDQAEVDKCKSGTHDTSQFNLPIPSKPAEPEECPVLLKPCSQAWTDREYTNTPDAPLASCTPCQGSTSNGQTAVPAPAGPPGIGNWGTALQGNGYSGISTVYAQSTQSTATNFQLSWPVITLSGTRLDGTWAVHGAGHMRSTCTAICKALGVEYSSGIGSPGSLRYPSGILDVTPRMIYTNSAGDLGIDDWHDFQPSDSGIWAIKMCECLGSLPR